MTELEERVLARLSDGRWRIIGFLAESLGVPRRSIEAAIEALRLAGHPIIGGDTGVRLSDSASEVREYAQDRRRRLVSVHRGTRALLATARRMEGVRELRLWDRVS